MKKIKFLMRNLLLFSILLLVHITLTDTQKTPSKETQSAQLVSFDLNEEKLLDIVNKLAGLKQVNILLPNDQKTLGDTTVTFKLGYKISVAKAWEMMLTMLDIAKYALISHNNNLYEILPSNTIRNCSAPLYINTKTEIIKSSEATIRYLYYFQNINLKEKDIKANLETILKDMLPGQPEDPKEQSFLVYEQHNSLLITSKANAVKSVIDIIRELDQGGFREAIEVIPVLHTNANEIVDIINKLKPKVQDDDTFRFPPLVAEPKNSKTYFSASSRIIAIAQTNSVAIFGLYESVQRIKDFIQKYLDKSIDTDKTVLHVKPLKYLVSKDFAATLENFVKQKATGAPSTGKSADNIFNNVIIQAEELVVAESKERKLDTEKKVGVTLTTGATEKQGNFIGGNSLIIAATHRDWQILDKLITSLDTQQWQVALEVLIVDMTINTNKSLKAQLRRIANDNKSHEFKWQSAQIVEPALDYTGKDKPTNTTWADNINSTRGVESDLLSTQPGPNDKNPSYDIGSAAAAGTSIFTFKDKNGTAAILQLLDSYEDVKVLSRPFVITKNNHQANILQKQMQWVRGAAEQKSLGGTPVFKYEEINAAIQVSMTPRISRDANSINLEIQVDANEFVGNGPTVTMRTVRTNANVGSGEVLVLGGITKISTTDSVQGIPLISKIPIIGNFFKSQNMEYEQRNLVIFICPVRISPTNPQTITGPNQFTLDKIDDITNKFINYSPQITCAKDTENFQCLGDPIANYIFPYAGAGFAGEIKKFTQQKVWTKESGTEQQKQYYKDIAQFESGKYKSEDTKTAPADDKLKNILKNETNPLTKKT